MKDASLYFSDVHLGADYQNLALVQKSFDALTPFLRENYLRVTQAVDLGDHTEEWLSGNGFEYPYETPEVILATRQIYRSVFNERKPVVLACPGNHQTKILDADCSAKEALASSERACKELRMFLHRVFSDLPEADVTVFRGLRQTEDQVFAHHGDFLNVEAPFREVLGKLSDDMTAQQKMDFINEQAEIYEGMQKEVWQKFRKYLWPALKNVPGFVDRFFPAYVTTSRMKGLFRETEMREGSRSLAERWKNPIFEETQMQLDLLSALSDAPDKSAIISGHFHVPGLVSDVEGHPGTVVSLGAWHDTHLNPAVAITMEQEKKMTILLTEYDSMLDQWNIRDEKTL